MLDHIYDKEAIKNSFKEVGKYSPGFFSRAEFVDKLRYDNYLFLKKIILYSPETYYEIIEEIMPELFMKLMLRKND